MKKLIKQNWFKIATFAILLVVGLSIAYYFVVLFPTQQQNLAKQQTNSSLKNTIDMQAKCADAAKNFFNEDKWGRAAEDINSSNVNYTDNYNSKYNKCFVLITERFSDGSGISLILFDVFGHKEYANGSFGTNDYSNKKSYCTILNGDCKSSTDFNRFVSEYMEN